MSYNQTSTGFLVKLDGVCGTMHDILNSAAFSNTLIPFKICVFSQIIQKCCLWLQNKHPFLHKYNLLINDLLNNNVSFIKIYSDLSSLVNCIAKNAECDTFVTTVHLTIYVKDDILYPKLRYLIDKPINKVYPYRCMINIDNE